MYNFLLSAMLENTRKILSNVFLILMTVLSVAIVVVVLMQEGETGGVSAISGGNSDTFYGKNKGRSKEHILKRVTLILGALMLAISIVFFLVKPY